MKNLQIFWLILSAISILYSMIMYRINPNTNDSILAVAYGIMFYLFYIDGKSSSNQ